MTAIERILTKEGPMRAKRLAETLVRQLQISAPAARQRLSRSRMPIKRHSGLLPKKEAFFFLATQRKNEQYWTNLLRDLREVGSIYGYAMDGLAARGGIVPVDEFAVVSGAPLMLKKQVSSRQVADVLLGLNALNPTAIDGLGSCYAINSSSITRTLPAYHAKVRHLAEEVILDGLRQWLRNNGIGGYDSISIRGEGRPMKVGQFQWDLTGPCYLLPVRRTGASYKNGFVVADVFSEGYLDKHHIQYFIRKVQVYTKTANSGPLLPILMAEGFSSKALTAGHAAGLMLTTPKNLFGQAVANSVKGLVQVLKQAIDNATVNSDELCRLLGNLLQIEGRANNMRGILFELIASHIAKEEFGGNTSLRVAHTHHESGQKTDLDVVCMGSQRKVHIIECKGKSPAGSIPLEDVEEWLGKIPIMKDYVETSTHIREYKPIYEFWTTGTFQEEALLKLKAEKSKRKKQSIAWKDGQNVRDTASKLQLGNIAEALDQHFLRHPLSVRRN